MNSTRSGLANQTPPLQTHFQLASPQLASFRLAVLLLLLPGLLVTGCQIFRRPLPPVALPVFVNGQDGMSFFAAKLYAQSPPRRVLILPVRANVQPVGIQMDFAQQLAGQVRSARLFEAIVDPALGYCSCDMDAILRGRFDEYRLLELTDRYHADAILLTRVNRIQSFDPLQISVTCALVDRNQAIVLAAADGNWSVSDPQTANNWNSWLQHYSASVDPETLRIHRQSPTQFQSFIAWQIARRLGQPLGVDTAASIAPVGCSGW